MHSFHHNNKTFKKSNLKPTSNLEKCAWPLCWMCIGFYLHSLVFSVFLNTFGDFSSSCSSSKHNLDLQKYHNQDGADNHHNAVVIVHPSQDYPSPRKKKHWCVVTLKYLPKTTLKHFSHFPHSAEILLPCWSWFMEQDATENCGYFFHHTLTLSSWSRELIESMGCEIKTSKDSSDIQEDGTVVVLPQDDVQFIPNLYLLRPRLGYIRYLNDASHAHALRRKLVNDEYILSKKGPGKPLQIGMIQRRESRRIGNFEQIRDALQSAISSAEIITTDFAEMTTVKEQAEWFATKDVIVAAHGAAVTNSIFITQGTLVMQLFPPGYFWPSLDPLIEQSGGYAIQWYEKGKDPSVVSATMTREDFDRAGKATFSPPVQEVVQPILYALGIVRPTNFRLKQLFKEFV